MKQLQFKYITSSLLVALFLFLAFGSDDSKNKSAESTSSDNENTLETTSGTEECLVGYDWVYPSGDNPTAAWKFSSDGTFNSSTTAFGGMSAWGNWSAIAPGEIKEK